MTNISETHEYYVFHITEHMSPSIDGRGTSVLLNVKIIDSILSQELNSGLSTIIITGRWHLEESSLEILNGFQVYKSNVIFYLMRVFKLPLMGPIMKVMLFPCFLLLFSFYILKSHLKNRKSNHKVILVGHHLFGALVATVISILTSWSLIIVLYGTESAYSSLSALLEDLIFRAISRYKHLRVFVLDDGSSVINRVYTWFGEDIVTIYPQTIPEHTQVSECPNELLSSFYTKLQLNAQKVPFLVFWLSGFTRAKNPEQAVGAFISFGNHVKTSRFILFGDGILLNKCKMMAMKIKNIKRQVLFIGRKPINEVICLLKHFANVVLITSKVNSNFGRVALEALACKIPIIVTDTGRTKKFIPHLKAGIVCKNSPEDIKNALFLLFTSPKLQRKIGITGHRMVWKKYTLNKRRQSFEKGLRGIVGGLLHGT